MILVGLLLLVLTRTPTATPTPPESALVQSYREQVAVEEEAVANMSKSESYREAHKNLLANSQKRLEAQLAAEAEAARKARIEAQAEAARKVARKNAAAKKDQRCREKWSSSDCDMIASRQVWVGMTAEQAIASWGRPQHINSDISAAGRQEQWVYGDDYIYVIAGKVAHLQIRR